jgi:hypothetical protein
LAGVVVVVAFAVVVELLAPTPDLIAFVGALRTAADGVYAAEVVVALEPAEDDPEAANDVEAPGPEPPADACV